LRNRITIPPKIVAQVENNNVIDPGSGTGDESNGDKKSELQKTESEV